jgi:hypothetical protein
MRTARVAPVTTQTQMVEIAAQLETKVTAGQDIRMAAVAWVLTAVCLLNQYIQRSAPGVMMPDLPQAFGRESWTMFGIGMGLAGLVIGVVLFFLIPSEEAKQPASSGGFLLIVEGFRTWFVDSQSVLRRLIAGLLFIPTTILDVAFGSSLCPLRGFVRSMDEPELFSPQMLMRPKVRGSMPEG